MSAHEKPRPLSTFQEFQIEHALAHELPYWDFLEEEGLAVLSDGTLVRGFRLQGISIETWSDEQINELTLSLRGFLNGLSDGLELQLAMEQASNHSSLIDEHEKRKGDHALVGWLCDERVKALRSQLEMGLVPSRKLYLFVYLRATDTGATRGKLSFFSAPKLFSSVQKERHKNRVSELSQLSENVKLSLGSLGIETQALESWELSELAYRILNPTRCKGVSAPRLSREHRTQEFTPDELAKVPELSLSSPRQQLAMSDLIQGVDSFFLDGLHHRVVTLKTLPEMTFSAMASKFLASLPFHFWLSAQITVPEQSRELSALQTKRRMAHSMTANQGGRAVSLESEAKLQSTEELLRELLSTGQKIFYFQFALLLRSDSKDELEKMTKMALAKFREMNGAEAVQETVAGFKLFKTMLPAGVASTVRSKRIKTDNLADFLPLYQPWENLGSPFCLFRNRDGGLVSYDPYDSSLPNFNALVTGSSGAGKSFIYNMTLLQCLGSRPLVSIIDIGGSYRKLCELMGGSYVESGLESDSRSPLKLNPFTLSPGEKTPSPRKVKFLIALMELLLTDEEGDKLPKLDRACLEEAILTTYGKCGERVPTLSDFRATLEQNESPSLKNYAKMLYPWTGERPFGRLLDTQEPSHFNSELTVFDLKGLSSYPDLQSVMILILTDFILQKIDETPGRKKRIILDECWELLKSKPSRTFMEYCVRTLRKTGSGITFVTQGLEEIEQSEIGPAILGNTATKIILSQRGGLESVAKTLRLNEREVALIRGLRREKGLFSEAFFIADQRRGVIQLQPTALEYWISTSDAADNALLSEARELLHGKSFPELIHWLATHYPNGCPKSGTDLSRHFIEEKEAA